MSTSSRSKLFLLALLATACSPQVLVTDGGVDRSDGGSDPTDAFVVRTDGSIDDDAHVDPDHDAGPGHDAGPIDAGPCDIALDIGRHLATAPAAGERPATGEVFRDPTFGACVQRVTDADSQPPVGFTRHDYSRRQAFNADDSFILTQSADGHWHVYDASTSAYVRQLEGPAGDCEAVWHPTDPNILRFMRTNGSGPPFTISEIDVTTNELTVWRDITAMIRAVWPTAAAVWSHSEGAPSTDQRYWGFEIDDAAWNGLGLAVYDAEANELIGTYDLAAHGAGRPDHVSMTPSGRSIVACWNYEETVVFDRELGSPRRVFDNCEHSDIAVLENGHDAFIYAVYDSDEVASGSVQVMDLDDGTRFTLIDDLYFDPHGSTAVHVSGRAIDRPGWAVLSFYGCNIDYGATACPPESTWMQDRVIAISLSSEPQILNLAWHRSVRGDDYFAEPQATSNRDLTRVLFASNWGGGTVDLYQISLPRGPVAP